MSFLAYFSAQFDPYTCNVEVLIDALATAKLEDGGDLGETNLWLGYSSNAHEFNAMFLAGALAARCAGKQPPFRRGQMVRCANIAAHEPNREVENELLAGVYEVVGLFFYSGGVQHWLIEVRNTKNQELRHRSPTLYSAYHFTLEEAPAGAAK